MTCASTSVLGKAILNLSPLGVCIVLFVSVRLGCAHYHVHFVEQFYIACVDIVFVDVFSNISGLLLSFNILKL